METTESEQAIGGRSGNNFRNVKQIETSVTKSKSRAKGLESDHSNIVRHNEVL